VFAVRGYERAADGTMLRCTWEQKSSTTGPWPPDECSRCLLTWFDHGWINAHVLSEQLWRWSADDDALLPDPDDKTARLLKRERARAILADPQTWTNDSAEGLVILTLADHAPSSDLLPQSAQRQNG